MLYPIVQNGKYGFIAEDGSLAVQPQFESAMMFSEDLAGIKQGGKWGFVDSAGQLAIEPQFSACHGFSHGLALVETDGGKQYINRSGKVVFRADFYECRSFEEDLAWVVPDMQSRAAFMDCTGKIVLAGLNFMVSKYSHGLINCADGKKWGYVNRAGEFVIPPKYAYARPFREGLAAVAIRSQKAFSFIDTQGQVAIAGEFQGANIGFSGGLCAVWNKRFGYIDRTGRLVIPYRFEFAGHFSEGLAVSKEPDSESYGYVDEAGQIAIKPKFAIAGSFRGKLAHVIIGEDFAAHHYGYIDRWGKYVWKPSR